MTIDDRTDLPSPSDMIQLEVVGLSAGERPTFRITFRGERIALIDADDSDTAGPFLRHWCAGVVGLLS